MSDYVISRIGDTIEPAAIEVSDGTEIVLRVRRDGTVDGDLARGITVCDKYSPWLAAALRAVQKVRGEQYA